MSVKKFSEREGITKVRTEIQLNSMDSALRNRLWNVLDYHYWSDANSYSRKSVLHPISTEMRSFLNKLYHSHFKEPVDAISNDWKRAYSLLRLRYFNWEWHRVYDFIEFIANVHPDEERNSRFVKTCNEVLESERSAYRFVGKQITKITSEKEISEIEEALESPLKNVSTHLENALKLMSDRVSPDYRNSIKESISAVEATCNLLAGKKVTLGQCLKEVKEKIGLHGALEKAFSSLYGYTSEAEGIRHALMDEPTLSFEDAKFMLVSCSAFVNYLISKATKASIKLG